MDHKAPQLPLQWRSSFRVPARLVVREAIRDVLSRLFPVIAPSTDSCRDPTEVT